MKVGRKVVQISDAVNIARFVILVFEHVDNSVVIVQQRAPLIKVVYSFYALNR